MGLSLGRCGEPKAALQGEDGPGLSDYVTFGMQTCSRRDAGLVQYPEPYFPVFSPMRQLDFLSPEIKYGLT